MQLYQKKRIEIIVELPLSERVTRVLLACGVTGFTLIPALGGAGHSGAWSREGMIGRAGQMVAIIAITTAEKAQAALNALEPLLTDQIVVVSIGSAEVLRDAHF